MKLLRIILPLAGATLVAGCNTLGQSTFECPLTEKGAACLSARQIYEKTHVADRVQPNFVDGKPITPESAPTAQAQGAAAQGAAAQPPSGVAGGRPPLPEIDSPLPVRTPAQVMRIRVFPWEDSTGDLQTGGFVFTEIRGRTWTIGEDQIARIQANVISPLTAPARMSGPSVNPVTSATASPLIAPKAAPPLPAGPRAPAGAAPAQPLPSTTTR